jgi:hypothetical protein
MSIETILLILKLIRFVVLTTIILERTEREYTIDICKAAIIVRTTILV